MDEAARKVLKDRKTYIKNNLILNDDVLDSLEVKDVLNEEMVQTIKAERTPNDKIYRLLLILTRRGPDAFEAFTEAIRPEFGFLSDTLEDDYARELEILKAENKDFNHKTSSPKLTNKNSTEQAVQTNDLLCKRCTQQITPYTEKTGSELSISGASDFMKRMMQESFRCWYTKLKSHMTSGNMRELSFKSPEPVTYDMVDQLLDQLINTVNGCYRVLGVKDNLVTQIIHLKESRKKLKQELKQKEEQKNKYADNIMKLENKCRDYREQNETTKRQNQKLHSEIISLREKTNSKLKGKDEKLEEIEVKYNDTLDKCKITEEMLKDAEAEIEALKDNLSNYGRNTGKFNLHLQGAKYESRAFNSRNTMNIVKRHASGILCSPRKNKHSMHTDSTVLTTHEPGAIIEVKQNHNQETAQLTDVEEPDAPRLKRTETFVENCRMTSACPAKEIKRACSATSDKENSAELNGQQQLQCKNKSNDSKEHNQQLIVCHTDGMNETAGGSTTKRTRSRRPSFKANQKRYTPGGWSQPSLGISGMNVKNNRDTRQISDNVPRVLDTLVIVSNNLNNNSNLPESPRGPKAMKKHH